MANRGLGTLTVSLVAEIGGFVQGMDKAERQSKKRLDAIERSAKKAGVAIGAAFVAAAGIVAVGVKRAIDSADAIDEMSERTGISAEALSRLEVAATLTDTSLESLQKGIVRVSQAQLEARKGTEDQIALFQAFGISVEDLDELAPEEILKRIADGFQSMEDPAAEAALAVKLFGKAGVDLLPFLNQGSEGLAKFDKLADDLGVTLSKEAAAAAGEFNDQLAIVQIGMDGVWRKIATDLLPTLNELAKDFNDPQFREGFSTIVVGATNAAIAVAGLISQIGNLTKFAAEELARKTVGPGLQDEQGIRDAIKRQEALVAEIRDSANPMQRYGRFAQPKDALGLEAAEKQLQKLKGDLSTAIQMQEEARQRMAELPAVPEPPVADAGLDAMKEYLRLLEEQKAARESATAADKAAAEAARELEKADADLQRRLEEMAQQQADFNAGLDALEAQLSGPLAEAELDHANRMKEVQALLDQGVITVEEATRAQMLYAESFEKTRDQIDPYGEGLRMLLEDMDFELDLLDKTNAERVTELELRRLGIKLGTEEAAAAAERIRSRVEEYEAMQEQISAMDDFRSSFEDNVAGVLDGSKSISDALKDMVNDFIAQLARLAAQKFTEQLFGQMGSGDTGAAGGWLSGLFGAFTARASGGPVSPGVPYLVGEQGPELIVPSASGTVISAGKTASMLGGRGPTVYNFNMPGRYDMRTQQQMAADMDRINRRATARGTA